MFVLGLPHHKAAATDEQLKVHPQNPLNDPKLHSLHKYAQTGV
jgi:hypothetical protein